MAGNIIPAIATTNAVIAGVIVMEALRILDGRIEQCRTVRVFVCVREKWFVLAPTQRSGYVIPYV